MATLDLMAVFAHPDDESLCAAGLIADTVARGLRVGVVCATRGEAGVDRAGRTPTGEALGALRWAELRAACSSLGAKEPVDLGLRDGELASTDGRDRLREVLHAEAPRVLVTMGPDGAYGHRDHTAVTRWLGAVRPDGTRLLHALFPRGLFEPLHTRLRRALGARSIEERPAEGFGSRPEQAHLVLRDVDGPKRRALAAHASQLADGDVRSFLLPGIVDRLLR